MEVRKIIRQREAEQQAARRKRRRIVGAAAAAAGVAAAGVLAYALWPKGGEDQGADAGKVKCVAEDAASWVTTPSNFKAETIARTLGVSADQVRRGQYGDAKCERTISPSEINTPTSLLTVQGIGGTCMAVGVMADRVEASNHVLVVCAAQ